MTHLTGKERLGYVSKMFGRISNTYDRLNRLMTFGQDLRWRKEAVSLLDLKNPGIIIDLGAGTGDMTAEILRQDPESIVIGLDLTPHMLKHAKARIESERVNWVIGEASNLPFSPNTFSAVISGFLMRNLPDLSPVLQEQQRVLCENGTLVCLETSPVTDGFLKYVIHFYIHRVIPFLGKLISRDPAAYSYLASSTKQFLSAEKLSMKLHSVGFQEVVFVHRMFGTVAIHSAHKG